MIRQSLDGAWTVRDASLSVLGIEGYRAVSSKSEGWLEAQVPGEIHLDLIRAGLMPEPLVGTRAPSCRWPEDRSWWYRTRFDATPELLANELIELVFDGLDCYAEVFLNGKLIGESDNALVESIFDVTHELRATDNELVVRLTAGTERMDSLESGEATASDPYGGRNPRGRRALRKPQFTYGWDWVDALPNVGIWRSVRLEGHTALRVHDVRCSLELAPDRSLAELFVEADLDNLHPWRERIALLEVELVAPDGRCFRSSLRDFAPVGLTRFRTKLAVDEPALWWPRGMGKQPLYELVVRVSSEDRERARWTRLIGLRKVSVNRAPLPEGHRFCIEVNGEDVFCRGANWIPADAILARVDHARYDALLAAACEANMNTLRVWGGGVYESDYFYEACDRAGLLVWQDFMFACLDYPDERRAFREEVRREAELAVRRLRHHPSIVLWSGNNENNWGFLEWWNHGRSFPHRELVTGGSRIYGHVLSEVCQSLDPSRPYWPSSPFGGDHPNGEVEGDCHFWPTATMSSDVHRRYRDEVYDECRARFVSEYGVIGPCHLSSTQSFLEPDECTLGSRAWQVHTNQFEKGTTAVAIGYHYGQKGTLTLEQFLRYGQMFQALLYGRSLEALRFRKKDPIDECAGALIWMLDDCWGEHGWTPIDYYLRRKPSYYWIKNALHPVRVIVRRRGDELVTRLVNDTLEAREVSVELGWLRVDGSERRTATHRAWIEKNGMLELCRTQLPRADALEPSEWIYAAWAPSLDGDTLASVHTLVPHRELIRVDAHIEVTRRDDVIELCSPVYCHGVSHADDGAALLSDNYFDLLPGVKKTLRCLSKVQGELCFLPLPALC